MVFGWLLGRRAGGAGMRMGRRGGRRGWRDGGMEEGMEEGDELEALNEIETLLFILSATLGCHGLLFFFKASIKTLPTADILTP